MKLTIEKTELMDAINRSIKAVPAKAVRPIMSCFLLEANGNDIRLTANDFELGIQTHLYGMVLEGGAIALNAKLLSDIVRKMPDSAIYLETDEKLELTLKCDKCMFCIQGIDATDFSPIKPVEKDMPVTIKQHIFKDMIKKTIFCVSKNENDKLMTAINLMIDKNQEMRITALDGHRMAICRTKIDYQGKADVNIPGKTMAEIGKLLSEKEDDEVSIYLDKNYILFEMEQTVVTSRLIDGVFYKTDQLIRNDWNTKISINRENMINTLDRATLFVRADDKRPVIMNISENEISIKITNQFGNMDETMELEKEGKDIRIAFNPYYLLDCLKLLEDEQVTWRMLNPKAPSFIENEEKGYLYLILPVNIGNDQV